ncbi:hypothetical protein K504DRAFT_487276 [Pleomassaria siparia CBS 279.74]|uniref:Uncharacterized protein n=1 Tax=Pleomassaria siparia CBS 279.74 TaxID=1314801 RepID=A0A6G1KS10_9PLEO|nr:hypothetical protein K504DRAFT_487276 [Pleomassaria siparia CBS 279.74]
MELVKLSSQPSQRMTDLKTGNTKPSNQITMTSSSRHSSIRPQDRRRSSANARRRSSGSLNADLADFDLISNEEYEKWLYDQQLPQEDLPEITPESPLRFDSTAYWNDPNYEYVDQALPKTDLVGLPGAGPQVQTTVDYVYNPTLALNNAPLMSFPPKDYNAQYQSSYPDPTVAQQQYQTPYYRSYNPPQQQYMYEQPQSYAMDPRFFDNDALLQIQYPVEEEHTTVPANSDPDLSQRRANRKRARSDSEDDSEDPDTPYKKVQYTRSPVSATASSRSRGTSLSDVSDAGERKLLRKSRRTVNRASAISGRRMKFEKPKLVPSRPDIRTNTTTKGLTTRTGKINNYESPYEVRGHPVGDWEGPKYAHKYTPDGEFYEKLMSAAQIKEFILHYPTGHGAKLKLWIQRCPADSARRYPHTSWSKCRFRDCPANKYLNGTILHGHFRVAFDEKWHRDRENVDPYHAAGYAHLYCMERFLDFPEICRKANVEVDTRSLSNEPNGSFAATMANMAECGMAQKFVSAAKHRRGLNKLPEFVNYPKPGELVLHGGKSNINSSNDLSFTANFERSLTYQMHNLHEWNRAPAQVRQFEKRELKASNIPVHMGDLEMFHAAQRYEKKRKQRTRKRKNNDNDEKLEEEVEGPLLAISRVHNPDTTGTNSQPTSVRSQSSNLSERPERQIVARGKGKAKHVTRQVGSDSEEDARSHVSPLCSSPRSQKQQQPEYTDEGLLFEPERPRRQQPQTRQHSEQSQPKQCQQVLGFSNVHTMVGGAPTDFHTEPLLEPFNFNYQDIEPVEPFGGHDPHGLHPNVNNFTGNTEQDLFPIDPYLENFKPVGELQPLAVPSPKIRRSSRQSSLGKFDGGPEYEFFNFDEFLARRQSRLSMSKSIMKRPSISSPLSTKRNSGASARRVSIGKTTTREFYKSETPHTVAQDGRRHSARLLSKVRSGSMDKNKK